MMSQSDFRQMAQQLDNEDRLSRFRDEFWIPTDEATGQELTYLAGHSLGLQPKQTARFVREELEAWKRRAVRGHFTGSHPWMPYHEFLTEPMASLVGARPDEVVMMNSLTVNLHLMMATFYKPKGNRRKILIEQQAFPSDHYAVESQIRWRGLEPAELLTMVPKGNSGCFDVDTICSMIEDHRQELALIMLPAVHYYTGQVLDIARLTRLSHDFEIPIGFDLAHAAGNIELHLHEWDVDFAVWCSYKYLNSGPGSVGGCYIHRRHAEKTDLPRLAGWWGHDKNSRFQMGSHFRAIPTAEGWQVSNPPILSMAAIRSSLDVFQRAGGMSTLREKAIRLTGFMSDLLQHRLNNKVRIVTPKERGCQLSLEVLAPSRTGPSVKQALDAGGFETDWREPNVIRAAPVPLYNRYIDVHRFVERLNETLT